MESSSISRAFARPNKPPKRKRKRDLEPSTANKKQNTATSISSPHLASNQNPPVISKRSGSLATRTNTNKPDAESDPHPTRKPVEMSTLPTSPLGSIKALLKGKFELAELSVISSHKIEKRVSRVLEHLGRFSWTNMAVLPGVVLAVAREKDTGKVVSVIELAKRRLHEDEHKYYQYNGLYHIEQAQEQSVIEETAIGGMDDGEAEEEEDNDEEEDEEGGFGAGNAALRDQDRDVVMPDRFVEAITPNPEPEADLFMAIFLSRVPVPELNAHPDFTTQTNEAAINSIRARRNGGN